MSWQHEFTTATTPVAPTTYEELSRQLQMFLLNLEHDKFYPGYRTLIDAEDVRSRDPWITHQRSPLRWAVQRLDRCTKRYNASGRQAPSSAMEVGTYCSKAAIEALRYSDSTVPKTWQSTSVSPNEITRLRGMDHLTNIALYISNLWKVPEASAAANSALAVMAHNLMLPDNDVINRLEVAIAGVEHNCPSGYHAIAGWYVSLNGRSLSEAIGGLRNIAHQHLWALEDRLLGPHP